MAIIYICPNFIIVLCGTGLRSCQGFDGFIHQIGVIRGVEKDDIKLLAAGGQEGQCVAGDDTGLVLKVGDAQIFLQQSQGIPALFHEGTVGTAAGEGLNAQLAGAAEEVQHLAALQIELDDLVTEENIKK